MAPYVKELPPIANIRDVSSNITRRLRSRIKISPRQPRYKTLPRNIQRNTNRQFQNPKIQEELDRMQKQTNRLEEEIAAIEQQAQLMDLDAFLNSDTDD